MRKLVVAIDGPAGAGKSTVAQMAAKELGFTYIDTGAMYRSIAYALINKGIDPEDADAVKNHLDEVDIEVKYIKRVQHMYLDGKDISKLIRTNEISMGASSNVYCPLSSIFKYCSFNVPFAFNANKTAATNIGFSSSLRLA